MAFLLCVLLVPLYVMDFCLMENSSSVEGVIWSCKQCGEIPLAGRVVVDEKSGKYETVLSCLYHKATRYDEDRTFSLLA